MRRLTLIVLAIVLTLARPVGAQVKFSIGPVIGYYRPFGKFDPASVYATNLPGTPQDLRGLTWGGAARVWLGRRFGAELQASFTQSTIPGITTPGGPSVPTSAQVDLVVFQGLFTVLGAPSGHQVWLSAGPGLIHHGGTAYAPYALSAQLAAVAGAGARVRISRRLQAAFGLNGFFYTFDLPMPPELRHNPGSLQHGRQIDALLHLGLSWTPGEASEI